MKDSLIEWTDHTWNPWRGCTKVSPGCVNCYAETLCHRFGIEWGQDAVRVEKGEAGWNEPLRWAKREIECGYDMVHWTVSGGARSGYVAKYRPARVFALSLGDWLEGDPVTWRYPWRYPKGGGLPGQPSPVGGVPAEWIARMLDVIRRTPTLNWILVTKRPENFDRRLLDAQLWLIDRCKTAAPFEKRHDYAQTASWIAYWRPGEMVPQNVCVMASVEDQERAEERIPHLLRIPARWHGLSLEPLLGHVDLGRWLSCGFSTSDHFACCKRYPHEDCKPWLVIGGESGPKARPCNVEWIRSLVSQGREAGCAVFVKQLGAHVCYEEGSTRKRWLLDHRKGGDPSEWTEDLRVREWPEGL